MDGPVAYDKRWRHAIRMEKHMRAWKPPAHLEHIKSIPGRVQRGKVTPPIRACLDTSFEADNTASAPDILTLEQSPIKQVTDEDLLAPSPQRSPTPAPIFSQTTPVFNNAGMNPFMQNMMSSWLKPLPQRAPRGMERAVKPSAPVPMGLPKLPPKGRRWMAEEVQIDEPQADILVLGSTAGSARSSRHSGQGPTRSLSAPNLAAVDEAAASLEASPKQESPKLPPHIALRKQEIPQSTLLRALPHVAPPEGWQHPPQLLSTVPTNKAAPEYQRFRGTVQFQGRVNWVV